MWRPLVTRSMAGAGIGARIEPGLAEVPTARGLPLLGTIPSFVLAGSSSQLHKYIDRRHKQLGPIFRESVGPVDAVFVSDPDVMRGVLTRQEGKYPMHVNPEAWLVYNERHSRRRGLLFMDGEEWLQCRRLMNRILLSSDAERWIRWPVEAVARGLVDRWAKAPAEGYRPDLEVEMYRASLEVVLAVMMGSEYSKRGQSYRELLIHFSNRVHEIFLYTSKMVLFPAKFYANLNLPAWKGFVSAVDDSISLGQQLAESLCDSENVGDGLLGRMMAEGMDRETIIRILIDFIIAAGDTTSFTLQWALYQLSLNPDIVKEFRSLKPDSESREKYMRSIIKETMRLYPVATFLTRILPAENYISGYKLPAGTLIVMSTYTSSRDDANFTNPLKFAPKRWDKAELTKLSTEDKVKCPHATLPFAIGSRSCVGRKIALIQMNEILTKIVTTFDMELLNEYLVEDDMQMILKPKDPINILFKPIQ